MSTHEVVTLVPFNRNDLITIQMLALEKLLVIRRGGSAYRSADMANIQSEEVAAVTAVLERIRVAVEHTKKIRGE